MQNYITSNTPHPAARLRGTLFGGTFNTIIGIIFLVIVLVSPDGLLGLWGRLFQSGPPRWRRTPTDEVPEPAQ